MIEVRRSSDRGAFEHGWLKSRHTFSFSEYYDAKHMRFRMLRVINEDWVQPKSGFPTHSHQNMEIITYVISGTLAHSDSLGNKGVIRAGEIQRMSAGSGIEHSEFNPDAKDVCHLLQIWLFPDQKEIVPSWEQVDWKAQPLAVNGMRLLVSPDQESGSAKIHQDARLWHASLGVHERRTIQLKETRGGWLQVICGAIEVGGVGILNEGDALAAQDLLELSVSAKSEAEYLWFDLA